MANSSQVLLIVAVMDHGGGEPLDALTQYDAARNCARAQRQTHIHTEKYTQIQIHRHTYTYIHTQTQTHM